MAEPALSPKPPVPPSIRWGVLLFVSIAMFGNYYIYDCIAPLASALQAIGLSSTQLGTLNAIYSFPNIIMVLIGGIIVDRIGTRASTFVFTAICLVGAVITAMTPNFVVMATGRLIFGLGAESMIVAITAVLGQWFKGKQLGFAFGINLAIARAGSYAADMSPTWARSAYAAGWRQPMLISVGFAVVALAAAAIYWLLERSAEPRYEL
ncbi:MAG TPA: MFS transporter, partial [Candidatus Saccharimonadales bacterium]|nr:MFS transporter [Candidatus Saccharimonadales bacterium]